MNRFSWIYKFSVLVPMFLLCGCLGGGGYSGTGVAGYYSSSLNDDDSSSPSNFKYTNPFSKGYVQDKSLFGFDD
jgi:hypothetical protein